MSQPAEFDTTSIPDDGLSEEQIEALMQQAQQPPAAAAPQFQAQPAVVQQAPASAAPPPEPVQQVQQVQQQAAPVAATPPPAAAPAPESFQPSTVYADQAAALRKQIEELTAQAADAARRFEMGEYAEFDTQRENLRLQLLEVQTQAAVEQQQNATTAQAQYEQQVARAYSAVVSVVPALADPNSPETQRYNAAFQTMVNNGMLDANDPLAWQKVHATIVSVGGIQPQAVSAQQTPQIASFQPHQGSGTALPSSPSLLSFTADDFEKMTDAQLKEYEQAFQRQYGMTPQEYVHRKG
jgi:hypothetical protein